MKIAHIINTLAGGGAERTAIEVYRCLEDLENFENEFIIAKNIIEYDIDFTPKTIFNLKKKPFYIPAFLYENMLLKKLEDTLKTTDVVISHLRDMNTRLCYLKAKNRLKSKLIIVEHVPKELYSNKEIDLIKSLYKYADVSVGVSSKVVENLKEYWAKNIHLIENFVDIKSIETLSKEKDVKLEGFSFLSMGRLSPDKDFKTLIEAFKIANIENAKLYILGEGKLKDELVSLVKKLNLENKVIFLGFKKNPFPYVKSCDCYITSSVREAFPLATLEAMGLGKAVISTDVVPFVKNMENALVIPIKDPNALANAMVKIYNDRILRENISKNALKTAMGFSKEVFCKKYKKLLQNVNIS